MNPNLNTLLVLNAFQSCILIWSIAIVLNLFST